MTYVFRNTKPQDYEVLLTSTTEGGKVDPETIRDSVEIKTLECDGEPIMIIGRTEYPTGDIIVATCVWGIFSTDIDKHTKKVVQTCKDLLFDRIGFRFLVLIDETNPKFERFAEFFGFKRTNFVEEKQGTVYHLYIKET